MIDVERLLFELHVFSGSGPGYMLTRDAVNLRLTYGEEWEPSFMQLQKEVRKYHACTYDSFRKSITKISSLAWMRNRKLFNQYAHRELEKAPSAEEFIEILYTYILRNR